MPHAGISQSFECLSIEFSMSIGFPRFVLSLLIVFKVFVVIPEIKVVGNPFPSKVLKMWVMARFIDS